MFFSDIADFIIILSYWITGYFNNFFLLCHLVLGNNRTKNSNKQTNEMNMLKDGGWGKKENIQYNINVAIECTTWDLARIIIIIIIIVLSNDDREKKNRNMKKQRFLAKWC